MWSNARDSANDSRILENNSAGITYRVLSKPFYELRRGGKYINHSDGLSFITLSVNWSNDFSVDMTYNILYSFVEPFIGTDITTWDVFNSYVIDSGTSGTSIIDASSVIALAGGSPIYFAAISLPDFNNFGYPDIPGSSCFGIIDLEYEAQI